jgi:hypothetical protein
MLIGDPAVFAIESQISIAYENLSFRALGFFALHIGGCCYGVREPDATMLACPFGEVGRRLSQRGSYTAPFATEPDAGGIADALYDAAHAPDQETELFFGIPQSEFTRYFWTDKCDWNPGDEAFDDGSGVLQFDVANGVRLIGYRLKRSEQDYPHDPAIQSAYAWEFHRYQHDPATLSDVWLDSDTFYEILRRWRDAFEREWSDSAKVSEKDEDSKSHLAEIIRLSELTQAIRASQESKRQ